MTTTLSLSSPGRQAHPAQPRMMHAVPSWHVPSPYPPACLHQTLARSLAHCTISACKGMHLAHGVVPRCWYQKSMDSQSLSVLCFHMYGLSCTVYAPCPCPYSHMPMSHVCCCCMRVAVLGFGACSCSVESLPLSSVSSLLDPHPPPLSPLTLLLLLFA